MKHRQYKSLVLYICAIALLSFFSCKTTEVEPAEIHQELLGKEEIEPDLLLEESDPVADYLSTLSIEKKIGQLIFINARKVSNGKEFTEVNEELSERIRLIQPGGVLLFGGNLNTIPQSVKLIEDMQSLSSVPLFIGSDIEGGPVNRLRASDAMHATELPSNGIIGKSGDLEKAALKAQVIGKEMYALGINMNFAPVADIHSNPSNRVIGNRSFGSDPAEVSKMVEASVISQRNEGVAAVLKHFPGHGDTFADSHLGSVSVEHNEERLKKVELVPFLAGIDAGADGIMTAHIQVPQVTGDHLPATLSPQILTGLLREKLAFDGLIITDSMGMGAITKHWGAGEAAFLAVQAGVDIILNPALALDAYEYLLKEYEEGRLSQERVDQSVYRIIRSKMDLGIMDEGGQYIYHRDFSEDPESILGNEKHREISSYLNRK